MSYLDRYQGKRRVIRKALKLHDKREKFRHEIQNVEYEIEVCEGQMTGGDLGAYRQVMGDKKPSWRVD